MILANKIWLTSDTSQEDSSNAWNVYVDPGVPMQIPHISVAGVVLISVLLAVFLTALLCMTAYAHNTPIWTSQLDSMAMMQMAAAKPHAFPLGPCYNPDSHRELDEQPGWMGDDAPSEPVGKLAVGASSSIGRRRVFQTPYTFANEHLALEQERPETWNVYVRWIQWRQRKRSLIIEKSIKDRYSEQEPDQYSRSWDVLRWFRPTAQHGKLNDTRVD